MTRIHSLLSRISMRPIALALALVLFGSDQPAPAAETNAVTEASADADKAWKEVEKSLQPPMPPAEWQTVQPPQEQIDKFLALQAGMAGLAADKARDFYTRFPGHAKAGLARQKQLTMLQMAVQLGNTNRIADLDAARQERLKDPGLPEDERYELRIDAINRALKAKAAGEGSDMKAEAEKAARALIEEFPKRSAGYEVLLSLAQQGDAAKARSLAEFMVAGDGPDEVKAASRALLKKLDGVGKPLELKFTALDGREVDVSKLSGKVVLVDFWATWCMPCVAELPHVKQAYEKLHTQGFEIIGISLDEQKEALEKFIQARKIDWPQHFDGKGFENKFAHEFGVQGIPEMWLVDKKGNLRELNARGDLEAKVEKLLAE